MIQAQEFFRYFPVGPAAESNYTPAQDEITGTIVGDYN